LPVTLTSRGECRTLDGMAPSAEIGSCRRWLVAAVIAAQVAVPIVALANGVPSRFGFQMYSGRGGVVVEAVDARRKAVPVDLDSILPGLLRPEFDWTGALPEAVCATTPSAARVTVRQQDRERSIRC
jgi:hypothetical protein